MSCTEEASECLRDCLSSAVPFSCVAIPVWEALGVPAFDGDFLKAAEILDPMEARDDVLRISPDLGVFPIDDAVDGDGEIPCDVKAWLSGTPFFTGAEFPCSCSCRLKID